jgi:hypothetical protein
MGTWGFEPWENDIAADWFGNTWDECSLPGIIERTLNTEIDEYTFAEIRAAAHVMVALGRVYIWPISKLREHLKLAVEKLGAIAAMDVCRETPELAAAIDRDMTELRTRLSNLRGGGESEFGNA